MKTQEHIQDKHEKLLKAHDAIYKGFFSDIDMVRSLLEDFIREPLALHFNFDTLERVPGDRVSDKFVARHGDIVWRVKSQDATECGTGHEAQEQWCYLYLMLEFQSTIDRWMAVRVLTYTALLWQDLIQQKQLERNGLLPPVLPIVIYSGKGRWTAKTCVSELMVQDLVALRPYQPQQQYFVLDEGSYEIHTEGVGLAALLMQLEKTTDMVRAKKLFKSIMEYISEKKNPHLYRLFTELFRVASAMYGVEAQGDDSVQESNNRREGTMFLENIGHWIRESYIKGMELGRSEGEARGEVRGEVRGKAEGMRTLLLQFAQSKWGELPPQLTETLCTIQDARLLEILSENFLYMTSLADFTNAVQNLAGTRGQSTKTSM